VKMVLLFWGGLIRPHILLPLLQGQLRFQTRDEFVNAMRIQRHNPLY